MGEGKLYSEWMEEMGIEPIAVLTVGVCGMLEMFEEWLAQKDYLNDEHIEEDRRSRTNP